MSTINYAATPVARKDNQARKHLQRLVRKVKHVLIVKRCIDDLKNGASRMRGGETTQDILDELPNGLEILPDLSNVSSGTINAIESTLEETTSILLPNAVQSDSILKQLPEVSGPGGSLNSIENVLDSYISDTYDAVRKCKQRVLDSSQEFWTGCRRSRDSAVQESFWISWAKKRAASVRDNRALALIDVFYRLDEGLGQLKMVQAYLDAYRKGSYGRAPESLSEVIDRLRAVFGIGWFFEWPSGQHPLNSTWPWADVKPALLVLWGVCWMFLAAPYGQPPRPGHPIGPLQSWPHNDYYNYLGLEAQPIFWSPNNPPHPQLNMSNLSQWMPENTTARLGNNASSLSGRPPRANHVQQPQEMIGSHFTRSPAAFAGQNARSNSTHADEAFMTNSPYASNASSAGGPQDSWLATQLSLSTQDTAAPSTSSLYVHHPGVSHPSQSRRTVAKYELQPLWRETSDRLTQSRAPDHLGENPLNQAAIPHSNNSRTPTQNRQSMHPPSIPAHMPSSGFSNYPPLDQIPDLHNSQPYMVGQERVYQDMPEYEQHHDPQDQPRYPTPPPPLSDPYNTQQGIDPTADGRLDMPMEQKSDSDAQSPGRSKPVPKPDREVTKDANGRFYCNWQGCTEDVKDFGRKCEWSKHMDKHDRPYKCPADGCEKLPGFTYSGGLLRHEREVHGKHGGPRKQLNCPHPNCKRHTGKGFSRQENLNEHLRRVHTDTGLPVAEDTEDEANEQLGVKRKRVRADSAGVREEVKRLKAENEELKRQAEAQTAQTADMMRQIMQLQQAQQIMQHPRMQAPPAQMT